MSCQLPGCSKPIYPGSAYCTRSHRDAAPSAQPVCKHPGCSKLVYPGSLYCSKTHRDAAPSGSNIILVAPAQGRCRYPGCQTPAHPGGNYCSMDHRDSHTRCKFPGCWKQAFPGGTYCSKSHRDNAPTIPLLKEIPSSDAKFQDIVNQFSTKWLHSARKCPKIHKIYRVMPSAAVVSAYEAYRSEISKSTGLKDGNQNRRFHGTNRMCTLGDTGTTTLCNSSECSLCMIVKTSFKLNKAGDNKSWMGKKTGRFGRGIYTSATSSKSDDYSTNKGTVSNYKAMFLTKVVVGHGIKYKRANSDLTAPPKGYHSVIGEPDPDNKLTADKLNYDELVVYNEAAVIPAYLIIYRGP